jgi:hypothetical protein
MEKEAVQELKVNRDREGREDHVVAMETKALLELTDLLV